MSEPKVYFQSLDDSLWPTEREAVDRDDLLGRVATIVAPLGPHEQLLRPRPHGLPLPEIHGMARAIQLLHDYYVMQPASLCSALSAAYQRVLCLDRWGYEHPLAEDAHFACLGEGPIDLCDERVHRAELDPLSGGSNL